MLAFSRRLVGRRVTIGARHANSPHLSACLTPLGHLSSGLRFSATTHGSMPSIPNDEAQASSSGEVQIPPTNDDPAFSGGDAPPRLRRSAVGHYRTSYFGEPDLHLRDCYLPTTSATKIPTPLRSNLTQLFRRFRDVDQSDSAILAAKRVLDAIDPATDIALDVDFACLCLNSHHTFRIAPSEALLQHVATVIAPRLSTPVQLEIVVSAFHDMAPPVQTRDLLASLMPLLDELSAAMRKETVVLMATRLVDAGLAPPALLQALQERAVMLIDSMTFHEVAQLALALAVAPVRPPDVREVFETDFAPQLMKKIHFSFAQDVAAVLYAFAEVQVPVPELVAQCASRVFMMHEELDADGVAMTFVGLALMQLRAPKLTKSLVAFVKALDPSTITALGALDMAHAMVHLGVHDDVVMGMLTARIVADRAIILASPAARAQLLDLNTKLAGLADATAAATSRAAAVTVDGSPRSGR